MVKSLKTQAASRESRQPSTWVRSCLQESPYMTPLATSLPRDRWRHLTLQSTVVCKNALAHRGVANVSNEVAVCRTIDVNHKCLLDPPDPEPCLCHSRSEDRRCISFIPRRKTTVLQKDIPPHYEASNVQIP